MAHGLSLIALASRARNWILPLLAATACGGLEMPSARLEASAVDLQQRFLEEADEDGDQRLSLLEVEHHVERELARQGKKLLPEQRPWIRFPFLMLDLDGNGFIVLAELRQFEMSDVTFGP